MNTKLIISLATALALFALNVAVQAQQVASTPERTVLPPPDPAFRGKIDVAIKDSTAAFPELLKAPKGTRRWLPGR